MGPLFVSKINTISIKWILNMKITEICESTTSGAVATVAAPMNGGPMKRSSVGKGVYGGRKAGNLLTGKKTSKPFANSLKESEQVHVVYVDGKPTTKSINAKDAQDHVTTMKKKYPNKKYEIKKEVNEAQLEEEDLILIPGQGHKLRTGFHSFDPDKAEHEGETLKNSLRTIARNAKELHSRLENSDQFPEWVSEKIGQIKGMMTGVTEYLISNQTQAESGGVVAGGGVGESRTRRLGDK